MEFIIDVESDGPCPPIYSMVSFAIVDINNFDNNFKGLLAPISGNWQEEALVINGISRDEHNSYPYPTHTMKQFEEWIIQFPNERHTLWSDNIAFDWMFIHYYQYKYLNKSYFGHSGRRIGDVYSGFIKNIKNHSSWKKWRKTKHTHNPMDDAIGNAEALNHLKKLMK